MKYQNDIDKMNTNRNLFLMLLPIFVELLLQLLVGNVDQMMVSRVSQPSAASVLRQRFWFLPGTRRFTGRSMCRRKFLMRRRCIC